MFTVPLSAASSGSAALLCFVGVAAATLALDQLAKARVLRGPGLGGRRRLLGPLVLRPRLQPGAWLARPAPRLLEGLVLLAGIAGALLYLGGATPPRALSAALGLVVGGAAGNHLDRVRRGGIVDFLDLGRGLFNLADVALGVGWIAAALLLLADGLGRL